MKETAESGLHGTRKRQGDDRLVARGVVGGAVLIALVVALSNHGVLRRSHPYLAIPGHQRGVDRGIAVAVSGVH